MKPVGSYRSQESFSTHREGRSTPLMNEDGEEEGDRFQYYDVRISPPVGVVDPYHHHHQKSSSGMPLDEPFGSETNLPSSSSSYLHRPPLSSQYYAREISIPVEGKKKKRGDISSHSHKNESGRSGKIKDEGDVGWASPVPSDASFYRSGNSTARSTSHTSTAMTTPRTHRSTGTHHHHHHPHSRKTLEGEDGGEGGDALAVGLEDLPTVPLGNEASVLHASFVKKKKKEKEEDVERESARTGKEDGMDVLLEKENIRQKMGLVPPSSLYSIGTTPSPNTPKALKRSHTHTLLRAKVDPTTYPSSHIHSVASHASNGVPSGERPLSGYGSTSPPSPSAKASSVSFSAPSSPSSRRPRSVVPPLSLVHDVEEKKYERREVENEHQEERMGTSFFSSNVTEDIQRTQYYSGVPLQPGNTHELHFEEGDYVGTLDLNGCMTGVGRVHWHSGDEYVGEWLKDAMHGRGVYTWADGDRYEGEYVNGCMQGVGMMIDATGKYVGDWFADTRHGFGKQQDPTGNLLYEGQWQYGKREGHGVLLDLLHHTSYEGSFHHNLKHGHGVETNEDGDVYEGEFVEGLPHGHGRYHYADGSTFCGRFKAGVPISSRRVPSMGGGPPPPPVAAPSSSLSSIPSKASIHLPGEGSPPLKNPSSTYYPSSSSVGSSGSHRSGGGSEGKRRKALPSPLLALQQESPPPPQISPRLLSSGVPSSPLPGIKSSSSSNTSGNSQNASMLNNSLREPEVPPLEILRTSSSSSLKTKRSTATTSTSSSLTGTTALHVSKEPSRRREHKGEEEESGGGGVGEPDKKSMKHTEKGTQEIIIVSPVTHSEEGQKKKKKVVVVVGSGGEKKPYREGSPRVMVHPLDPIAVATPSPPPILSPHSPQGKQRMEDGSSSIGNATPVSSRVRTDGHRPPGVSHPRSDTASPSIAPPRSQPSPQGEHHVGHGWRQSSSRSSVNTRSGGSHSSSSSSSSSDSHRKRRARRSTTSYTSDESVRSAFHSGPPSRPSSCVAGLAVSPESLTRPPISPSMRTTAGSTTWNEDEDTRSHRFSGGVGSKSPAISPSHASVSSSRKAQSEGKNGKQKKRKEEEETKKNEDEDVGMEKEKKARKKSKKETHLSNDAQEQGKWEEQKKHGALRMTHLSLEEEYEPGKEDSSEAEMVSSVLLEPLGLDVLRQILLEGSAACQLDREDKEDLQEGRSSTRRSSRVGIDDTPWGSRRSSGSFLPSSSISTGMRSSSASSDSSSSPSGVTTPREFGSSLYASAGKKSNARESPASTALSASSSHKPPPVFSTVHITTPRGIARKMAEENKSHAYTKKAGHASGSPLEEQDGEMKKKKKKKVGKQERHEAKSTMSLQGSSSFSSLPSSSLASSINGMKGLAHPFKQGEIDEEDSASGGQEQKEHEVALVQQLPRNYPPRRPVLGKKEEEEGGSGIPEKEEEHKKKKKKVTSAAASPLGRRHSTSLVSGIRSSVQDGGEEPSGSGPLPHPPPPPLASTSSSSSHIVSAPPTPAKRVKETKKKKVSSGKGEAEEGREGETEEVKRRSSKTLKAGALATTSKRRPTLSHKATVVVPSTGEEGASREEIQPLVKRRGTTDGSDTGGRLRSRTSVTFPSSSSSTQSASAVATTHGALPLPRPRVFSSSDFEGWRPIHLLGRGSYGAVYKGVLRDGVTIACCKVIDLSVETNDVELHRLHMEVALMKQLYHPNVVQYYGSLEENSSVSSLVPRMPSLVAATAVTEGGQCGASSQKMSSGEKNGSTTSTAMGAPSREASQGFSLNREAMSTSAGAREGNGNIMAGTSAMGTTTSSALCQFSRLTIFMEFVNGCSLNQVLKKFGPIPFPTLRQWVWQMVLGVQYLHSRGIVHRDIKGANILLSYDGVIKLVDFGCSKWLQDPSSLAISSGSAAVSPQLASENTSFEKGSNGHGSVVSSLPSAGGLTSSNGGSKNVEAPSKLPSDPSSVNATMTISSSSSSAIGLGSSGPRPSDVYDSKGCHTLVGTPYWMAPEVICGDSEGYGLKSDIWSLGCTIVELLTGKPPWPESTSVWAAVWKIANSSGLPTEIPKDLDPELMDFLEACFERDPVKRPSAEELLKHPFLAPVPEGPAKPPETKSVEEH